MGWQIEVTRPPHLQPNYPNSTPNMTAIIYKQGTTQRNWKNHFISMLPQAYKRAGIQSTFNSQDWLHIEFYWYVPKVLVHTKDNRDANQEWTNEVAANQIATTLNIPYFQVRYMVEPWQFQISPMNVKALKLLHAPKVMKLDEYFEFIANCKLSANEDRAEFSKMRRHHDPINLEFGEQCKPYRDLHYQFQWPILAIDVDELITDQEGNLVYVLEFKHVKALKNPGKHANKAKVYQKLVNAGIPFLYVFHDTVGSKVNFTLCELGEEKNSNKHYKVTEETFFQWYRKKAGFSTDLPY